MKNWVKVVAFLGGLIVFMAIALRFLEDALAKDPGSTLVYVIAEWTMVAVTLSVGSTLFVEEAFKRPPKPVIVEVDAFVKQLTNGKLKLTHEGMVRVVKALDGRLKVMGEAIVVEIRKTEEKQTGIVIERTIS